MSKVKTYDFRLSHDPTVVIEKARHAAAGNGVRFDGDETGGRFSGHGIEGLYAIQGDRLKIEIVRKPIIMPWSMIDSALRQFFV